MDHAAVWYARFEPLVEGSASRVAFAAGARTVAGKEEFTLGVLQCPSNLPFCRAHERHNPFTSLGFEAPPRVRAYVDVGM